MVAVGNHSYRLGNATPNETKRANVLYGTGDVRCARIGLIPTY